MAWFAAHAVFYFEAKDGIQDSYSVWENVYLIDASDGDAASELAATRARAVEGDSEGTLVWKDRPSTLRFVGIRKLISVSHERNDGLIAHGDEITYSEFELTDRESLDRLVNGDGVALRYVE